MTHDEVMREARKRLSMDANKKELRDSLEKIIAMADSYHWRLKEIEPLANVLENFVREQIDRSK